MADIKLYELPDAGTVVDGDYLHLSQSSSDYKITITNLSNKFGEVDIYGLTENTSPVGADYLPTVDVSVGIDITSNRKVTLDNVSALFQTSTYFGEQSSVALADSIVFRQDGSTTQNEVGVDVLRDRVNDFSVLTTGTDSTIVESDLINIYDVSASGNSKFSISNMRAKMFDVTNVNASTTLADGDFLYFYDIAGSNEGKITYSNLANQIAGSVDISNMVTTDTSQTITGTKTFTSTAGILTDKISEATSDNGVSIDSVVMKDGNVTATDISANNLYGKLTPNSLYDPELRSNLFTGDSVYYYKSTAEAYAGTQNKFVGDFLEVYGSNTDSESETYAVGGLVPAADSTYTLGIGNREWEAIYCGRGYFSGGIDADGTCFFPMTTRVGSNTNLVDANGKITESLLPTRGTWERVVSKPKNWSWYFSTASNNNTAAVNKNCNQRVMKTSDGVQTMFMSKYFNNNATSLGGSSSYRLKIETDSSNGLYFTNIYDLTCFLEFSGGSINSGGTTLNNDQRVSIGIAHSSASGSLYPWSSSNMWFYVDFQGVNMAEVENIVIQFKMMDYWA